MIGTKGTTLQLSCFYSLPKGHVGALGVPKGVGGRGDPPPPLPPKKKKLKNSGDLGLVHPP